MAEYIAVRVNDRGYRIEEGEEGAYIDDVLVENDKGIMVQQRFEAISPQKLIERLKEEFGSENVSRDPIRLRDE